MLAFPLHMAVMADGSFPFGAVGLVHVENRIAQHRPIGIDEELHAPRPPDPAASRTPRAAPSAASPRRGSATSWSGRASARCCAAAAATRSRRACGRKASATGRAARDDLRGLQREWRLGGDLGRRYAAVSGDRNPIHMHSLTAKPLGFPAAIAHGMWTKARCLAALESRLPDAFAVDVRFRKPILLPGRVEFASATRARRSPSPCATPSGRRLTSTAA